jgi:hypothetical protein
MLPRRSWKRHWRWVNFSALVASVLAAGLAAGQAPAATAVPPADPKVLAVFEAEKGPYEKCSAKVDKRYPFFEVKTRPKPQSAEEANRNADEALKDAQNMLKRIDGMTACWKSLRAAVSPKAKAAGATDEMVTQAMEEWLGARNKARAAAGDGQKEK